MRTELLASITSSSFPVIDDRPGVDLQRTKTPDIESQVRHETRRIAESRENEILSCSWDYKSLNTVSSGSGLDSDPSTIRCTDRLTVLPQEWSFLGQSTTILDPFSFPVTYNNSIVPEIHLSTVSLECSTTNVKVSHASCPARREYTARPFVTYFTASTSAGTDPFGFTSI